MSNTEITLIALHRNPAVQLEDICEHYFGLSPLVARQRASLQQLPVPVFRLTESSKSPLMVHVRDLANHIDTKLEKATREWENSKV